MGHGGTADIYGDAIKRNIELLTRGLRVYYNFMLKIILKMETFIGVQSFCDHKS